MCVANFRPFAAVCAPTCILKNELRNNLRATKSSNRFVKGWLLCISCQISGIIKESIQIYSWMRWTLNLEEIHQHLIKPCIWSGAKVCISCGPWNILQNRFFYQRNRLRHHPQRALTSLSRAAAHGASAGWTGSPTRLDRNEISQEKLGGEVQQRLEGDSDCCETLGSKKGNQSKSNKSEIPKQRVFMK